MFLGYEERYITSAKQFSDFIKETSCHGPFVAIDTEFRRTNTYAPQLSLIQLATPFVSAVIDLLAFTDHSVIASYLKTSTLIKIFHAPRQDLEAFLRRLQVMPQNCYDVQLMAQFDGVSNLEGLDVLVKKYLGLTLNKTEQQSNWLKRPLSSAMLEYAHKDVQLLIPLYKAIKHRIEYKNCWFEEETQRYQSLSRYRSTPYTLYKKLKKNFSINEPALIEELLKVLTFRDAVAEQFDVLNRRVIKDEHCFFLVKDLNSPKDIWAQIHKVLEPNFRTATVQKKFFETQKFCFKEQALVIAQQQKIRFNKNKIITLKKHIEKKAHEQFISKSLLAPSNAIKDFLRKKPSTLTTGWRHKILELENAYT